MAEQTRKLSKQGGGGKGFMIEIVFENDTENDAVSEA